MQVQAHSLCTILIQLGVGVDRLVVLGISLDSVPDLHGHVGGHGLAGRDESRKSDLDEVRRKLTSVIRQRDINYPVLLDKDNTVGGRFNAGELPTTLIVDTEGRIRRRLVGPRTLEVFEAMVAGLMLQ